MKLLQQPPQRFDVTVVIGDVGILHIHPITHFVGKVFPLLGKFHHILAAGGIVFGNGNSLTDIFFGDAERLFNTQFHRKPVRVPSGFALHLEALHGFVAAENILNGARHYMVNTRHAIGRGRSFEKHERRTTFTFCHTLGENLVFVPFLQHFLVYFRKVKL